METCTRKYVTPKYLLRIFARIQLRRMANLDRPLTQQEVELRELDLRLLYLPQTVQIKAGQIVRRVPPRTDGLPAQGMEREDEVRRSSRA